VVISALIFEVERDTRARGETDGLLADWRRRIDRVVLVTAPDDLKILRYVNRLGLPDDRRAAADARSRLAHQIPDAIKATRADYLLENHGDKTGSPRACGRIVAAAGRREQQSFPARFSRIRSNSRNCSPRELCRLRPYL